MSFLKVWTEVDDGFFKSLPAKIVYKDFNSDKFIIKYMSPTDKRTITGKRLYTYEDETYEITEESIIQMFVSETEMGFEEHSPEHFIKCEKYKDDSDDSDYVPSSESETDSDWSYDSE